MPEEGTRVQRVVIGKKTSAILEKLEVKVDPAKEVFIKTNLLCNLPQATTDPKLVEDVIYFLRGQGAKKISIVESDNIGGRVDSRFKALGYVELAQRNEVSLINLTAYAKESALDPLAVPEMILKGQVVSLNNMKSNDIGYATLAGKNLLGLYPTPMKSRFHASIAFEIKKIIEQTKPILAIVDARRSMDGPGSPISGQIKDLGVIVGGTDVFAADYVCAQIMCLPARLLGYIPENLEVEVFGESIDSVKTPFKKPTSTLKNRMHYFVASHNVLFNLFNRYIETW